MSAKTLVLVGADGAGKSSVGRPLSPAGSACPSSMPTMRSRRAAGCSISDLFARYGEPAFRAGERRVMRRCGRSAFVIATGGRRFIDPETRAS